MAVICKQSSKPKRTLFNLNTKNNDLNLALIMTGRVIEKTYKYKIPLPEELFEAFKEKFTHSKLPAWNASIEWTQMIIGIFDDIGRSFGYVPRKEYLRLDETWEIRLPDISTIVMALESENDDSVEAILDDELQKLIDTKAFLKVLVFYPDIPVYIQKEEVNGVIQREESTYPAIEQKIKSSQIKNSDENYIIINPVYVKNSAVLEVTGCCFDSEGKGRDLGDFQIKYGT